MKVGTHAEIPLSQGKVALVDADDMPSLSAFSWHWNAGYAARHVRVDGRVKKIYMHREILSAPPDQEVDHINSNGLDNRRENLRWCTHSQNMANGRFGNSGRSRFRGVSLDVRCGKWRATLYVDRKQRWLGYHVRELDAAAAYNVAALAAFGEFARLNDLGEGLCE